MIFIISSVFIIFNLHDHLPTKPHTFWGWRTIIVITVFLGSNIFMAHIRNPINICWVWVQEGPGLPLTSYLSVLMTSSLLDQPMWLFSTFMDLGGKAKYISPGFPVSRYHPVPILLVWSTHRELKWKRETWSLLVTKSYSYARETWLLSSVYHLIFSNT